MESKITKCTRELRTQKWAEIVMECNSSGKSKIAWLRENNIKPKSFYYWQHKLREIALAEHHSETVPEIVQIKLPSNEIESISEYVSEKIVIRKCGVEVELPMNNASIEAVLKGLASC